MKILLVLLSLFLAGGPAQAQSLPDRVRFSIVVELGDVSTARDWLDAGLPPDFEGNLIGIADIAALSSFARTHSVMKGAR